MPVWVDGVCGAGVPGDDPGFTLGLNAFDTARSYGMSPFRLSAHLERLRLSARGMGVPFPGEALLREEILAGLAPDSVIRVALTAAGRRVLEIRPLDPTRVAAPAAVSAIPWPEVPGLPGWIKHGSRAGWTLTARERGVEELLLIRDGRILEASRSNVIGVRSGVLCTPPLTGEQLSGVTRQAMLDAAREAGLPLVEEPLPWEADYSELYLCSTLKELAPIVQIDGRPAPGGGPLGAKLLSAFRALVARECG